MDKYVSIYGQYAEDAVEHHDLSQGEFWAMKFWLVCFILLFVGAELFEWMVQLSRAQPTGVWLILGGMALAAASNAAHLPKADTADRPLSAASSIEPVAPIGSDVSGQSANQMANQSTEGQSVTERSAQDSISFKVRWPWL
ncbi:MAG: hypothetical protein WBC73_15760 [Phormidesmis sp.]